MSSLPPYNPAPTRRIVWLLSRDRVDDAVAAAGERILDVADGWVDEDSLRDALAKRVPRARWHVVAAGTETAAIADEIRGAEGSAVVVAREDRLHPLLCALLDLAADSARFRFLPGAVTTVQLLDDRAVIRHLNQGAAVEAPVVDTLR